MHSLEIIRARNAIKFTAREKQLSDHISCAHITDCEGTVICHCAELRHAKVIAELLTDHARRCAGAMPEVPLWGVRCGGSDVDRKSRLGEVRDRLEAQDASDFDARVQKMIRQYNLKHGIEANEWDNIKDHAMGQIIVNKAGQDG